MHRDTTQGFRRLFQQHFTVHDIAEPLASFDQSVPASEVRSMMEARRYEIAGLRRDGLVVGYVERDSLDSGVCGDHGQTFEAGQVIDEAAPLAELVLRLREGNRLFVVVFGRVGGIVSRTDLEKPAVRMWLFGMITLIEMRFVTLIETLGDESAWRGLLSEKRIEKAEWLKGERERRNAQITLLDCLQFADKAQIIAKCPELRARTRFESRRQVEQISRQLEQLRNHLAHSQEITETSWDMIVALAENLDRVLEGPNLTGEADE